MTNKFLRDLSLVGIRNEVNKVKPGFAQFLTSSRMPLIPRVVVYSNQEASTEIIKIALPHLKWITPQVEAGSQDEEITRTIANQLVTPDYCMGFALNGFPLNVRQALLLDRYVNGMNIAFYAKQKGNTEYEASIADLLNYYDVRGNLVSYEAKEGPVTKSQAQKLLSKIISHIKLSE